MGRRTRIAVLVALATMVAFIVQPAASAGKPAPAPTAPKSVILFIGDGMGPSILDLARLMSGGRLTVDSFQVTNGVVDTTSLDGVTDSAAASTAIATGVATHNGELAMAPDYTTPVETVLERAESLGKATGLITDDGDADATPAGFAAHVPDRDMKLEITEQEAAKDIEFMASGGWSYSYLLENKPGVTYVDNLSEMQPYLDGQVPWPTRMYGFFRDAGSLAYTLDREEEGVVGIEPTLPQLTQASLGVLSKDPDGFFVMIEAGSLDWGGHARDAAWVVNDTKVLMQSVQVALDYQKSHPDTLIVVTADHETGGLQFCVKCASPVQTSVIAKDKATTEWMWGVIQANPTATVVRQTLYAYAGIPISGKGSLSSTEVATILNWKEMGISDVLSARQNVTWGWSGSDEGDHTATPVRLFANGPWASNFAGSYPNETLGKLLFSAIGN
jgi:alkaline phosphatase